MQENFGERLRHWRSKLGISQNKLAQKSGISPVTIGQIETGKRRARHQTLQKILDGIGLTESKFFGGEQPASEAIMPSFAQPAPRERTVPVEIAKKDIPMVLSNLDLEIINRTLNLSFDGKLNAIKYLKNLE